MQSSARRSIFDTRRWLRGKFYGIEAERKMRHQVGMRPSFSAGSWTTASERNPTTVCQTIC